MPAPDTTSLWIGFNLFVLAMLALDLGVFHRRPHAVSLRESLVWTAVWIGLAGLFNLGVWYWLGPVKGVEFLTGYLIEKSLSIDNVFVFALIFSAFAVPEIYQHRVLFWGVLGALVMRAIMIAAGSVLLTKFAWIIYVFGAFLLLTGLKMIFRREQPPDSPDRHPVVRWVRRLIPVTSDYRDAAFFVREHGRLLATPLFVVLVLVEFSDLVFAVDSIPAIFAVTSDPFIVYTSNVFAILGLRSLYFALAGVMHRFVYLKTGLGLVLAFVGLKLLLAQTAWKIDSLVSLVVVTAILAGAVLASLYRTASHRGAGPGASVRPEPELPAG